jgi:hypothetical protein
METCVLDKKILLIGGSKRDYVDILGCLPEFTKVDYIESLSYVDFESFSDDHILCIHGGIMDFKGLTEADYGTIETFGVFRKSMKRISKLYQKNRGNLIIVTRTPIRYLLAYFKMLDDDPDMSALFANYYDVLLCNLSHNGNSEFVLHTHMNVYIIAKPNFKDVTDKIVWQNQFKMLVNEICAPYNTYTEKKGN